MSDDAAEDPFEELPSVGQIHAIHDAVVEEYDLTHSGTQAYSPDRRIQRVLDAASEFGDPYRRAAYVLWHLPRVHVYEDGNKRTAWLTAVLYLQWEGCAVPVDRDETARVLKHRARFTVDEFATWLATGEIDQSKLREH